MREPIPSVANATHLRAGKRLAPATLSVVSRMDEDGVVFADGSEQDFIACDWGRHVEVGSPSRTRNLIAP
ncbi:hypothetical protein ASG52_19985 [Methylobacterium sp. Leaf456]|nr:hypothetical protein ASG52_19985 [Methylobacterium sp. Leaf456]